MLHNITLPAGKDIKLVKSIYDQKVSLRKTIINKINTLTPKAVKSSNEAILKQVLSLPEYQCAKTIFAFVGVGWEVDTKDLLLHALSGNKRLSVPLCVGQGRMEARFIRSLAELTVGFYGLLEPMESCPACPVEEIDFALIPCVSCDRMCMRLGRGGGYYDRFLENMTCANTAVCRNIALVDAIPIDPWDRAVDRVVTETNIYKRGN